LSGNSTTPTKVGQLCRSSDIPFRLSLGLNFGLCTYLSEKRSDFAEREHGD